MGWSRGLWGGLLCLACGCDVVWQLEPRREVTGTTGWTVIAPGATGTFELTPQGQAPRVGVSLSSGGAPPVTTSPDGTFSFSTPSRDDAYRLTVLTAFADYPVSLEDTVDSLELQPPLYGRFDRVAPTTAAIQIAVSPAAGPSETDALASTGLRTFTRNPPALLEWRNAGSLSGSLGLLDEQLDRLHYLRYAPVPGQSAKVLHALGTAAVSMQNSRTVAIPVVASFSLAPVPPATTLTFVPRFDAASPRLHALVPDGDGPRELWGVASTPRPEFDALIGTLLAEATSGDPVLASYTLPIPAPLFDEHVMAYRTVITTMMHHAPGGASVTVSAAEQVVDVVPGGAAATVTLPPVGTAIAHDLQIAGQPSRDDLATLVLPDELVELTWLDDEAPIDFAIAYLYEVKGTPYASLYPLAGFEVRALPDQPPTHARFPRTLFESGHAYAIEVVNSSGYPNIDHWDVRGRTYPGGFSYVFFPPFVAP